MLGHLLRHPGLDNGAFAIELYVNDLINVYPNEIKVNLYADDTALPVSRASTESKTGQTDIILGVCMYTSSFNFCEWQWDYQLNGVSIARLTLAMLL